MRQRMTDYSVGEVLYTVGTFPGGQRPVAVQFAGIQPGTSKPVVVAGGALVVLYWRLLWKAEADVLAAIAAGLPGLKT